MRKRKLRLRWWQVRTPDFALFLFIISFQQLLVLPFWILAATFTDQRNLPFSRYFDTPIAGHHPVKVLTFILCLIWVYWAVCFITAYNGRCYHWAKWLGIFSVLFALLAVVSLKFNTLIIKA